MDNPADTCEKAGVQLPSNLGTHNLDVSEAGLHVEWGGGEGRGGEERGGEGEERECGVCVMPCGRDIVVPCGHFFCRDCWRQYLHLKIESGEAHSIMCQEYGCYKLVPLVSAIPHALCMLHIYEWDTVAPVQANEAWYVLKHALGDFNTISTGLQSLGSYDSLINHYTY